MNIPTFKDKYIVSPLGDGEKLDLILELNFQQEIKEKMHVNTVHITESTRNLKFNITGIQDDDFGLPEPVLPKLVKRSESENIEISLPKTNTPQYFQNQMNEIYIEMFNFNKDEILNYIRRDSERDKNIIELLEKIEKITKENLYIEQENMNMRKMLIQAVQGSKINQ